MFCSNCGKQLPDGAKFCNNCGSQQASTNAAPTQQASTNTAPTQQASTNTAPTQQAAPKKPEASAKKKPNIVVILAVVLCAFLFGKFVLAPSMTSDSGNGSTPPKTTTQTQQGPSTGKNNTSSAAYDAVFDDTYIVHFQMFLGMETNSFAMKQADGMIACSDYGYKNDVVKEWVETVYIPVSDYTDAQKASIEATYRAEFASIDALNCCAVTYQMSASYLRITCTYSNMDQASNYGELYKAGILQANSHISMSATETVLLNQGFIKK